jgi:mannose-6-phosphate isomerase-like protein (cupin superfamily)
MGENRPGVEEILDGETIIAVIVRASFEEPGAHFFSQPHFSQQLGVINYPAGHTIIPHVHNRVPREVMYTQETLFIRHGRCRVDLYRDDRSYLTSRDLRAGDVILLSTGGHGFSMTEDCSMIEVKQGPYSGEGDKTRFEGGKP